MYEIYLGDPDLFIKEWMKGHIQPRKTRIKWNDGSVGEYLIEGELNASSL